MPTLLVVHHTASPAMDEALEAVLAGARDDEVVGVTVRTAAALSATAADVLGCDGVLLGTPANMGYMSGALKVFFDGAYYPCLRETPGLPYGLYVHGGGDLTGAVRSVERLAGGLGWRAVVPPVQVVGPLTAEHRRALRELGGVLAATLMDSEEP